MAQAAWTPRAARELDDILDFIGVENDRPSVAAKIGREIKAKADKFAAMKFEGHTHPELPADWRYFLYKRWLIVFLWIDDVLTVIRVVDASRDLPSIVR